MMQSLTDARALDGQVTREPWRTVLVSSTTADRQSAGEAAVRHRALVADIPGGFPAPAQQAVADPFRDFAAGESVPRPRLPARLVRPVRQIPPAWARAQDRS